MQRSQNLLGLFSAGCLSLGSIGLREKGERDVGEGRIPSRRWEHLDVCVYVFSSQINSPLAGQNGIWRGFDLNTQLGLSYESGQPLPSLYLCLYLLLKALIAFAFSPGCPVTCPGRYQ